MKKLSTFLLSCLLAGLFGCKGVVQPQLQPQFLPRIGIAGISIECSTFSPAVTPLEAFRQREGEALLRSYPYLNPDSTMGKGAVWLPAMLSSATPGGIVTRETYEILVSTTLDMVRANLPYDAFFYHIHGAMSVAGLDDPEGDFLERIRNHRKRRHRFYLHGSSRKCFHASGRIFGFDHLFPHGASRRCSDIDPPRSCESLRSCGFRERTTGIQGLGCGSHTASGRANQYARRTRQVALRDDTRHRSATRRCRCSHLDFIRMG